MQTNENALLAFFLAVLLIWTCAVSIRAEEPDKMPFDVDCASAVLMDSATGTILYQKNADQALPPASVTKVMTLLLVMEAVDGGNLALDESVSVSPYAASMGGSQVYLEPGESMPVEEMLKCVIIASANDAAVALAEKVGGSEEAFVARMNERAAELGMANTHFENVTGLDDDTVAHKTSAMDIAIMSRELLQHPKILEYSGIWMDTIRNGAFGLTNTNKLIRQYEYATGLKTGSTSLAKYCVSATAEKDGLELIAVVMAAPDYKVRFADATTLLNYGFGKCRLYTDENTDALPDLPVTKGTETAVGLAYDSPFSYLSVKGEDLSDVKKEQILPETVTAPVRKGDVAGRVVYSAGGRELGSVNIRYTADVHAASYRDYFKMALFYLLT